MTRKEWLRLARLINGGTLALGDSENLINKASFIMSVRRWLTEESPDFDQDVFDAACYGEYHKELIS